MAGAAATRTGPVGAVGGGAGGGLGVWAGRIQKHRNLMIPAGFIALIMVIMVPMPTWMLDVALAANLTLSAVILVSVLFVKSPLELSVFPALLLGTTLYRLVLNVASTRLILTAGDRASNAAEASYAAGHVIYTFSSFVTGGGEGQQRMVVGTIIFIILVIIQFVVITKGATRIAEVAARFTLDAMPGKQMAIDADLNAGIIKEDEARRRRAEISREAEFYGAMDGASKFVRGDAVAGILITFVNALGGIAIGMLQYGWPITDCFKVFTTLTIGDGLVSQIPAFIISLAAGLLATRTASSTDMGEEFITQLTSRSQALVVACVFLVVLSVTGMPMIPMLILASCCGGIAWTVSKKKKVAEAAAAKQDKADKAAAAKKPEKIENLVAVDAMALEVGYQLVQLVDTAKGGDLLERITLIRRQIALEFGVVVPPIRIRDNMQLEPNEYVIKLRGNPLAKGTLYPGQYLAMDSGATTGKLAGVETKEPAFGLPAWWIPESARSQAEMMSYTVVEASGVLATHITEVIKNQAYELITREEVNAMVKQLKERCPTLVEEVIPAVVKPGELQRVLQGLLRERVPIRDLETIVETLSEWAPRTRDPDILTEAARHALARTICGQYKDENGVLHAVTLEQKLEEIINSYTQRNERGSAMEMPPQMARAVTERIAGYVGKLMQQGFVGVVLCSPEVRLAVRRLVDPSLPTVPVMSYGEVVKGVAVESIGVVGANG